MVTNPLKNPAKWSSYSYTYATDRKPEPQSNGGSTWFLREYANETSKWFLPSEIFSRLKGGSPNDCGWVDYPTYFDAIAAANDAARLAIQDGVWSEAA